MAIGFDVNSPEPLEGMALGFKYKSNILLVWTLQNSLYMHVLFLHLAPFRVCAEHLTHSRIDILL